MTTIRVSKFNKFHEAIMKFDSNTIFRGAGKESYTLLPKIGRSNITNKFSNSATIPTDDEIENFCTDLETELINEFKKYAYPFISTKDLSIWHLTAFAQHYGLPTRFLDWTFKPLVAAYFAVEDENLEEDAIVYATNTTQFNSFSDYEIEDTSSPSDITDVRLYIPPDLNNRISSQQGIFTVHNKLCTPLDQLELPLNKIVSKKTEKYKVTKIIVEKNSKSEFKRILNIYGINRFSIYPGLDGLCSHLEWLKIRSM